MRIVLGVSGGIAAYKAVQVLRDLSEAGHRVRVVPTEAALRFVGRATWEAISHEPVTTSVFEGADTVDHVRLGREADLMVVAPATADLLSRAAHGRGDDLLTATLLTVTCPVLYAPAMHTEMWQHPATRANVALLRERGAHVLDVGVGRLTGRDTGPGRLAEPDQIVAAALDLLDPPVRDLDGVRVLISAGGTREPLDPVRFLGNRSSGRQGVALAAGAARRGARVHLVAANVEDTVLASVPPGVQVTPVQTTAELHEVMTGAGPAHDVVVMAAAVADFRPRELSGVKIKKGAQGPPSLELIENPDILAALVRERVPGQLVIGFAAETGDEQTPALEHGRRKAQRKAADLLAVNEVGVDRGFGDVPNAVTLLDRQGDEVGRAEGSKGDVADAILDSVLALRARSGQN